MAEIQNQPQEDTEEVEEPIVEDDSKDENKQQAKTEKESGGPRFDEVDIMFYMFLAIAGDVADGVWIPRLFLAPLTILFLFLKGNHSVISKNAVAQGFELIPIVGWLPISTTAAVFTIIITNHPEKFEKWFGRVGKVVEKAGKLGKK